MERREDYAIGKYVLTNSKIFNVEKNVVVRNKFDFRCSYNKKPIESANTIEELIDYCIKNEIEIYAFEKSGNLTRLNDVPFTDLVLKRSTRLMMWQGKDLITAYEFEKGEII